MAGNKKRSKGFLIDMDVPDSQPGKRSRTAAVVTTVIIVVLILGYFPLGGYLFKKDFTIDYEIKVGDQYDERYGAKSRASAIDVVELDENGSLLVSGIALQKRYTELVLDVQGVDPQSLEVTATYTGSPEQLWMHVGGLDEKGVYRAPLSIRSLEDGSWSVLADADTALYQAEDRFGSLDEFYAFAATSREDIGLAGIDPGEVLARSLQVGETASRELLPMPLRGAHSLDMIVAGGGLHLEVSKRDLNRYVGSDGVRLAVEHKGATVYAAELPDDGDDAADGRLAASQQDAVIDLADIEDGLYTLRIAPQLTEEDFVITGVATDADKAVFRDRVFLFEPLETELQPVVPAIASVDLWLDSPAGILTATTWHPITPRSVWRDGRKLLAFEAKGAGAPMQAGTLMLEEGVKAMQVEGPGSLVLEFLGGGFGFAPAPLFDPFFTHLLALNANPAKEFATVLTKNYQPPEISDGIASSTREVDVAGRSFPGKKIRIIMERIGKEEVILTSLRVVLK